MFGSSTQGTDCVVVIVTSDDAAAEPFVTKATARGTLERDDWCHKGNLFVIAFEVITPNPPTWIVRNALTMLREPGGGGDGSVEL